MASASKVLSFPEYFGGGFVVDCLSFGNGCDDQRGCGKCGFRGHLCALCILCTGSCHDETANLGHEWTCPESWESILEPFSNQSACSPQMDRILADCASKINRTDAENELGILHGLLASADYDRTLRTLLELGADVEARFRPRHRRSRDPKAVVSKRALYVTVKELDGGTALHFAAHFNRPDCLTALLEAGVDLEAETDHGVKARDMPAAEEKIRAILTASSRAAAEKSGYPKTLGQLAKEKLWFAVRSRIRTGKVTASDLSNPFDGKTATEWLFYHVSNRVSGEEKVWNWSNDDRFAPWKILGEMKYRFGEAVSLEPTTMPQTWTFRAPSIDNSNLHGALQEIRREQILTEESLDTAVETMMEGFRTVIAGMTSTVLGPTHAADP